jgi:hypothetical protein
MTKYAAIPEFGQIVEYVTQTPVVGDYCDVVINTVKLADFDLASVDPMGGDVNLRLQCVLEDYVKVLRIKARQMNLTSADFDNVIPAAIRTRINVWLTKRGWTNVPSGWTYRQLFVAIKTRL